MPGSNKGARIFSASNFTTQQIVETLLAIPAFLPAMLCTGYVFAWIINFHNFRLRSLVERIFWSLPLSLAISTISSVLIGRFLSLTVVVVFYVAAALVCSAILVREALRLRKSGERWNIGFCPLGGKALALAILWTAGTILSLVDIQKDHQLFMNVALVDMGARTNWTESVLRSGVPPANSFYMYKHASAMRNYYFWYVDCAAITRMTRLPARAVCNAGCVWGGFVLLALTGLYLKHFLEVGDRLRRQFFHSVFLLTVTGFSIAVGLWDIAFLHRPPLRDFAGWTGDNIVSWLQTLLRAPNHLCGLVCCMLSLLVAWMAGKGSKIDRNSSIVLIAASLASAFGLSIYVTFAFFLVMLLWALWQMVIERTPKAALLLAFGGAGSLVLLVPYIFELAHSSSGAHAASSTVGAPLFSFAVRRMISPEGLVSSRMFAPLAADHPQLFLNLAKILLLVPGYALELGYSFVILLIYLVPAWRRHIALTPAQRSLVFIAVATMPFMSFIRSGVLQTNDFGWRSALLPQFCLVLLASEVLAGWRLDEAKRKVATDATRMFQYTPRWLRSITVLALVIGVMSTACQALILRFIAPLAEWKISASDNVTTSSFSHNAYISSIGYAQLDAAVPYDAIVQFNPINQEPFWIAADALGVDHQTVISSEQPGCGSELGGDPAGCPILSAAIDRLYRGATAEQARATCSQYGIQYLVARIYDPAWKDSSGWVWTLRPVVADNDFRALECK